MFVCVCVSATFPLKSSACMASDVVDGGVGGITNTQNPLTPTSMGGEYEYTRPNQTEQNQYKILYVSLTCECLTYLIALFYLVDSERMRLLDFDSAWLDFEELFFFDWTLLETNAVAVHQITNRYCLHLCTKICVIFQTFLSFLSLKMEEWNGFVFKKKKKRSSWYQSGNSHSFRVIKYVTIASMPLPFEFIFDLWRERKMLKSTKSEIKSGLHSVEVNRKWLMGSIFRKYCLIWSFKLLTLSSSPSLSHCK